MNMSDKIEQIRRAHASARPKHDNPAWLNTHRDLGVVLSELATVKNAASRLVGDLVSLAECMYVFGDGLDGVSFQGRPVRDVVADLKAAETAKEMQDALTATEATQ